MSQEISGHTKGPWVVNEPHAVRSHSRQVLNETGYIVAECQEWNTGTGRCANANARLIAAAPELLAALRELTIAAEASGWDVDADNAPILNAARAAIAKAGT
jgi:hypothetical protein